MKIKTVVVLAAVLVLTVTGVALAAKGKPKPNKPERGSKAAAAKAAAPKGFRAELRALGISCPAAPIELQGIFGGAGDGFLALTVSKARGPAKDLAGKQVALRLLTSTKILRHGPTVASSLKDGERLNVVALMCSQGLVARTVTAIAAKK